jgi:chorismate dehydratase
MSTVRVGVVRYLNAKPLVEGLDVCENLSLEQAVPSRIAPMLENGDIDIGLVSVIDFARATTPLAMIPVGMIGCEGPTLTVRVFSRVPPSEIRTLATDTDSHTSIALARIILKRVHSTAPEVVDFNARAILPVSELQSWPESVLLIGDKVVTATPPTGFYPYQIDLGQAWLDLTGLPFVYAIWMCRAADSQRPEIIEAAALLERQRLRNEQRLDWIVSQHAQARSWPDELAREYLGQRLRFSAGQRERAGIARFLEFAAGDGLAPSITPEYVQLDTPISARA